LKPAVLAEPSNWPDGWVAGRAETLEECRARLSTCLNVIDKLGGSMQGEKLL
jgi:hypothetical protein